MHVCIAMGVFGEEAERIPENSMLQGVYETYIYGIYVTAKEDIIPWRKIEINFARMTEPDINYLFGRFKKLGEDGKA